MNTDDLIKALAADLETRPTSVVQALIRALLVCAPITFAIVVYALHVRPDFWSVIGQPRVIFKFVFTVSASVAALWLALRLSRPGATVGPARGALVITGAILLMGILGEMASLPSKSWLPALLGTRATACMLLIPLISAAPLAALLYAMKAGAPDEPAAAGAAAGLLAGALGATFYASHCTDDSPLFVAAWYVIALAAMTVIGSRIGARVLKW